MKAIINALKKHKIFLVASHVSPDPDALCSQAAVSMYLRSIGKKVYCVNQDKVPARYHFLPIKNQFNTLKKKMSINVDAAVIVDCGDLKRIGDVANLLNKDTVIINIDHHITNDAFGHLNLIEPKASSTSEILYKLLKASKAKFDNKLAVCLYMGIMTDTGSFRFENTTAQTHKIIADLMEYNISPDMLYKKTYETIPLGDLKEFMNVLNSFKLYKGKRVVSVDLYKRSTKKLSDDFDLRDTIFKFLRAIQGVEVVAIFSEVSKNETRVNLRSSENFDVAKLAHRFNGGGHKRASGCVVSQPLKKAHQQVINQINKTL